jgi:phosphatidate cytidylyltransferase
VLPPPHARLELKPTGARPRTTHRRRSPALLRHRLPTGAALILLLVAVAAADARRPGPIVSPQQWSDWFGSEATPLVGGVLLLFTTLLVAPLLGWEFGRLLRAAGAKIPTGAAIAAVVSVSIAVPLGAAISTTAAALLPLAALLGVLAASMVAALSDPSGELAADPKATCEHALRGTAGVALAGIYAGGCLGGWLLLRQQEPAWVLAGGVLTVKSCDIGAYFLGRAFGRRRLAPRLSPGKSWEGLLGGVAASSLVGALLAAWSGTALPDSAVPVWLGAAIGAMLGIAGQAGDLAESLLKRAGGIKDSSRLLPGLGGVFDVMDSLLPAGLLLAVLLSAR